MIKREAAVIVFSALMLALLSGCSRSERAERNETVQGLQEENKVLREQIGMLQNQISQVKVEYEAIKSTANGAHEDQVAKLRSLDEEKVKHLELRIASLQIELGSVGEE